MKPIISLRCTECGSAYPDQGLPYQCPDCGGLFEFEGIPRFEPLQIDTAAPGIWRYRHTFDLQEFVPNLSLGEGNTPLVHDNFMGMDIAMKMEYLNPSGSYKDRAMAVIVANVIARGIQEAVEDSSGNAGASFAAYAARAGIKGTVYVPASVSEAKGSQIAVYGATIERIPGPRSAAARAVMERAQAGAAYASHAYLPFGKRGIATIAYEVWEQYGRQSPGTIIVPVGHGHLLMGIIEGFEALYKAKCINRLPYFVGVQADRCAPVQRAWQQKAGRPVTVAEVPTIAEGVSVAFPKQGAAILRYLANGKGEVVSASEQQIVEAHGGLARRGFYVEPTSALTWAALEEYGTMYPQPLVLVLTGSGLKTTIEH
ncbi:MAG: pyridoxal-phosphate dependent enzyme [Anaerolineae bacterium]|nr:pyridoxal-phosphate dependent enzyme [Anaerolineae bacterium]